MRGALSAAPRPIAMLTRPARSAALVLFVLTLQKDQYGYQFRQLAWTHLIVFFTVVPSSFFVPLIFEGLIWFCLPCALIIVNDIMAYLAGAQPLCACGVCLCCLRLRASELRRSVHSGAGAAACVQASRGAARR